MERSKPIAPSSRFPSSTKARTEARGRPGEARPRRHRRMLPRTATLSPHLIFEWRKPPIASRSLLVLSYPCLPAHEHRLALAALGELPPVQEDADFAVAPQWAADRARRTWVALDFLFRCGSKGTGGQTEGSPWRRRKADAIRSTWVGSSPARRGRSQASHIAGWRPRPRPALPSMRPMGRLPRG